MRVGARLALVAGLAMVCLSLVAPAAGANYARLEAAAGCDRIVTWRASASVEGSAAERTNERVEVQYRAQGSDDDWVAAGPEGAFRPDDEFAFGGSFELPDDVDAVELRVLPLVRWGPDRDGDEPGAPRFAAAEVPRECEGQPLVARQQLDCATGAVTVSARNVGDRPLAAEVVVDRVVVRELDLAPGSDEALVVPVLAGRPTAVRVRTDGFVASEQVQGGECPVDDAAAVVLERCGAPLGRLVVLATTQERSMVAEVSVRGSTVARVEVAPGTVLQRTLDVPTEALPVEVRLDDRVAASGVTGGCDEPVAGLLSCGTGNRVACDLSEARPAPTTTPTTPPAHLPSDGGAALPRTGPAQRALGLLLGGLLIAGGGLALAARDRRRPVPSVLGAALEPYRQRWWDDASDRR